MQRVVPGSVISGTRRRSAAAGRWPPRPAGSARSRVGRLELEVLVEDAEEAPEVGVAPFAAGALALLDDRVDRAPRGREVGDGDELRPAEVLLGRLGVRQAR